MRTPLSRASWAATLGKSGFGAWRAEVEAGIREALAVVTILSPASAQSAYVNYYWAFALGAGCCTTIERVRIQAARTLGFIGDPRAVPQLIRCLQDGEVGEAAAEAPETIGSKEARAAVKAWKRQNRK